MIYFLTRINQNPMDRKTATIELLNMATEAVELKRLTVERAVRGVVCQEVYCKQFQNSVDSMTEVVSQVIIWCLIIQDGRGI
jgi:hypothetical protein